MGFRRSDAIALLAVPLVVAAFKVESSAFSTICMSLAGGLIVLAMADHDDFPWKQRAAACGLVVALDLGAIDYLYRVNLSRELKEQAVPLIAATLPSPVSSNCPVPRGAVALYLGNTVSIVTEFPHVVFRVHGEDVLALDRDASGLLVSFRVFDDVGTAVARLERNTFVAVNPASHVDRPNKSNLIVFDDRNSKVLDVQFLNPQAIKITGILCYPGVDPIVITEKYLGVGGSISPPACRSGAEAEFSLTGR